VCVCVCVCVREIFTYTEIYFYSSSPRPLVVVAYLIKYCVNETKVDAVYDIFNRLEFGLADSSSEILFYIWRRVCIVDKC